MRDNLATAAHAVGLLLVLGAAVLGVLFVVPGLVGAESSHVVNSDSMAPAIAAGDVVVVQSTGPGAIDVGDVITYRSDQPEHSQFVTHRVVEVVERGDDRYFRTKGDANDRRDPELVSRSALVGQVWFTVPLIGYLITFAGTDLGLVAFVVLPALALVVTEAYALYREASADVDTEGDGT